MPGTKHFPRLQYNVSRALREIVAPRQTMRKEQWERLKAEFDGTCIFCGSGPTKENRGIVPDHLIPVTRFGELVPGNTVPTCQTCNDSRGEGDWRPYVRAKFPRDPELQIERVELYLAKHPYNPEPPEVALTPKEYAEYQQLLEQWDQFLIVAKRLYDSVESRRSHPSA